MFDIQVTNNFIVIDWEQAKLLLIFKSFCGANRRSRLLLAQSERNLVIEWKLQQEKVMSFCTLRGPISHMHHKADESHAGISSGIPDHLGKVRF